MLEQTISKFIKKFSNAYDVNKENKQIREELDAYKNQIQEPTLEYEKSRRKVLSDIRYFWTYFDHMWNVFEHKFQNNAQDWTDFRQSVYEYKM